MATPNEMKAVEPIRTADFGLMQHKYQLFSATVPCRLPKAILEDPKLWGHVATKITVGSEIRVLADDCSFRAILLCKYAQGTDVRMQVVEYTDLDVVDYDKITQANTGYAVKQRGVKKWCIIKTSTGEIIKELIPTQTEAHKELAEYLRALAA